MFVVVTDKVFRAALKEMLSQGIPVRLKQTKQGKHTAYHLHTDDDYLFVVIK